MNDKNCIIIHGCAPNPENLNYNKHWIPWVREELVKMGIKTETPLMPRSWEPVYEDYKAEFEKYEVNENTVLVGHSCACAFLVRWLGETKRKIAKLILVAPWKMFNEGDELRKAFYFYDVDETIKERVSDIVMFTSRTEVDGGKESLRIFHNSLGGKIISLEKHGHYIIEDMGKVEFPELVEEVIG